MIENLKGLYETVMYQHDSPIRLYSNEEYENYPLHWHTPIEIIMPTSNHYTAIIGGEHIHLDVNDILFICPGVLHALEAPQTGERIIFQAEMSMLRELPEIEFLLSLISPAYTISAKSSSVLHDEIRKLLLDITHEYHSNNMLSSTCIYSHLLEIFVLIARNYTANLRHLDSNSQKQQEYIEKFISICNYINNHCTEDLTLDMVANLSGFSKYHFSRLFKQFTNITFYKYLNQKRIVHAEMLLADPSINVSEVALSCGFQSLSAFMRMFKLIKKCTPTQYRNMYLSVSTEHFNQTTT
ncbi:MAG: helix-turn-helix domain-containing protein [Lachnospiraceae bacterium]|nr:helix-turn-helix domain-containing protein [Lachnospiraceae bacterium]